MLLLLPPAITEQSKNIESPKPFTKPDAGNQVIDLEKLIKDLDQVTKDASKVQKELRQTWANSMSGGMAEYERNCLLSAADESELFELRAIHFYDLFSIWAIAKGPAESLASQKIKACIPRLKDEIRETQSILRSIFSRTKQPGTALLVKGFMDICQNELDLIRLIEGS